MGDTEKKPEMEEAAWAAQLLKTEQIFPCDKKLVKKMMYESLSDFLTSQFRRRDSASSANPPTPPPPPRRSGKRSGKVVPSQESRP